MPTPTSVDVDGTLPATARPNYPPIRLCTNNIRLPGCNVRSFIAMDSLCPTEQLDARRQAGEKVRWALTTPT